MKNIYNSILYTLVLAITFTSCENYLDDAPKGSKVPTALADFEAFLRDEYTNQSVNVEQALNLLNDRYQTVADLAYYRLTKANYFWDETADRIALNQSDETTYYGQYAGISTFNLIIENALTTTNATEQEKRIVWAEAKVLRAKRRHMDGLSDRCFGERRQRERVGDRRRRFARSQTRGGFGNEDFRQRFRADYIAA